MVKAASKKHRKHRAKKSKEPVEQKAPKIFVPDTLNQTFVPELIKHLLRDKLFTDLEVVRENCNLVIIGKGLALVKAAIGYVLYYHDTYYHVEKSGGRPIDTDEVVPVSRIWRTVLVPETMDLTQATRMAMHIVHLQPGFDAKCIIRIDHAGRQLDAGLKNLRQSQQAPVV